jgi:hypothetical protein
MINKLKNEPIKTNSDIYKQLNSLIDAIIQKLNTLYKETKKKKNFKKDFKKKTKPWKELVFTLLKLQK